MSDFRHDRPLNGQTVGDYLAFGDEVRAAASIMDKYQRQALDAFYEQAQPGVRYDAEIKTTRREGGAYVMTITWTPV